MGKNIKGIIFDVDGVLEYQGKVYPGAVKTLETLHNKGIFIRYLPISISVKGQAEKGRKSGIRAVESVEKWAAHFSLSTFQQIFSEK